MNNHTKNGFTFIELAVLIVLVVVVIFVTQLLLSGKRINRDRDKAHAYASSMTLALTQFQNDYGLLPGEKVMADIEYAKADNANDCYRQLIQGLPDVRSEAIFYAPSRISKRPDDDIGVAPKFIAACGKGEVGFLYVDAPDASDNAPIAATPLYDTTGRFDFKAYNGKAIVLFRDGTVQTYDIDKTTGKVMADLNGGGKKINIFSPSNPAFKSPPVIKYPVPK